MITDPMGLRTTLYYDSGGRLNRIVYPVAPGESGWNDTTLTLSQINGSEFDLPRFQRTSFRSWWSTEGN
ncbi:hypothetical protein [Massilia sp. DWR3-1-1]|uniref:hypothetical protein n=1 Tax=Massilia sp. DWR3-1-1 TaxID=2804559 RepID=UPI003CF5A747